MSSADPPTITGRQIGNQPWEDYETVLRQAERARANSDLERARTFYARLIEINSKDPRGWAGLGATAASLDERIIGWSYALALVPANSSARIELDAHIEERIAGSGIADASVLVALGRALAQVGETRGARRLLVRATELDPANLDGLLWRAGISDDDEETFDCLNRALAIDPNNPQVKAGLEWAKARHKRKLGQVSPENARQAEELFKEGQRLLCDNEIAQAHAQFKRSSELDPRNESTWFWRGCTAPNTEQALSSIEQALLINPNNQTAKDTLWWFRVKKHRENFPINLRVPTPSSGPPRPPALASRASAPSNIRLVLLAFAFILFVLLALTAAVLIRLALLTN